LADAKQQNKYLITKMIPLKSIKFDKSKKRIRKFESLIVYMVYSVS